jgi:hypothetical protein
MSITYPPEMLPSPDEGEVGEVIVVGGQISSLAEPTCELRWVHRWQSASLSIAYSHTERFLQQRWTITDYCGGERIGARDEWRDVPVAKGEE